MESLALILILNVMPLKLRMLVGEMDTIHVYGLMEIAITMLNVKTLMARPIICAKWSPLNVQLMD